MRNLTIKAENCALPSSLNSPLMSLQQHRGDADRPEYSYNTQDFNFCQFSAALLVLS